jgi:TRAP-type uncharacterized transport system substrate-binding protein
MGSRWCARRRIGYKRVATDPECSGKRATLREILQTRKTDNQELDPLDYRRVMESIYQGYCRCSALMG